MRIMKLEEHLYFLSGFKKICLILKDYIQCGSGPTALARLGVVKRTQQWEEMLPEWNGWWAGQMPLLHWSPSRKPWPQLCLPPPPF